jgi:hypothetical protein
MPSDMLRANGLWGDYGIPADAFASAATDIPPYSVQSFGAMPWA